MPGGGMRWNSRLPKANAGRPKGSVDGVRRPGINGGKTKQRTPSEQAEDPFYIPGHNSHAMQHQPDWIDDVQDLARGQRMIRDALRDARLHERVVNVVDALLTKAEGGDNKSAELLLAYIGGKPVAFSENTNRDISGDEIASMADAVRDEMSKG